jgi:TonB family protein
MRLALTVALTIVLQAAAVPVTAATPARAPVASGVPSATYYKRSELDARPYLVTHVKPEYPTGVPPNGGKARIRLFINAQGRIDRVEIVESSPSAKFGEAAANAFRSAQFEPGKRGGVAVKSQIQIEMDFPPLLPAKTKK